MASHFQLSNSQLLTETLTPRALRGRVRSGIAIVAGIGILAGAASGCAKARAATVPDGPPLAMPLPPPRVFAPVDEEVPLVASPVVPETPTAEAPQLSPEPRPPRRAATTPPEREKSEPAPRPPQPAPEPPRELRAASAPADAEADRKIRALLQTASRNLDQVDYQKLSVAGKEQYRKRQELRRPGRRGTDPAQLCLRRDARGQGSQARQRTARALSRVERGSAVAAATSRRTARLPVCGAQRVRNSHNEVHSGPSSPIARARGKIPINILRLP